MATIRQIAREARVSVGTVSNVLNDRPNVSAKTRERVLEVMQRHNYRPSAIARSLSTGRTRTLGLVISITSAPFFTELAQGAIEAAQELGCGLLVAGTAFDAHDLAEQIDTLVSQWVDGIFIATQPLPAGTIRQLPLHGTSLVIMDHGQLPPPNTIGLVGFDWHTGAYKATRHLLELGHFRIGYVGGIPDRSSTVLREGGYRQALADADIPFSANLMRSGEFSTESGYQQVAELLQLQERPTAILTANDLMALGALQAIAEADLRVPQDISLVGMDNAFFAPFLSPPLTTVNVPTKQAGNLGVKMLLESSEIDGLPRRITIPTNLVLRSSTAPPLA